MEEEEEVGAGVEEEEEGTTALEEEAVGVAASEGEGAEPEEAVPFGERLVSVGSILITKGGEGSGGS